MKDLAGMPVSDVIFETITKRVEVSTTEPYTFFVHGVNAVGGKLNSAYSAFKKIEKWAESKGAEVILIKEAGNKLKVEITDPVAIRIESYFKKKGLYIAV